jgi:hypothetical protein
MMEPSWPTHSFLDDYEAEFILDLCALHYTVNI